MTEREVEERLAGIGLPDDIDEVLLAGGATPDAAALARIRQMTLTKAGAGRAPVRRRPWRQRIWAVAAAVALVAVSATVALGPSAVLARLLSYVPGLGLRDPSAVRLAAAEPVRLTRGAQWVEVRALLADEQGVTLNLYASGAHLSVENAVLLDGGEAVKPKSASVATSSNPESEGWYFFEHKLDGGVRRVGLMVEGADPWRLEVPLVPGDQLIPADQFGPSTTVNGYTIAARARPAEDRLDLSLLVQGAPAGTRITSLGRNFGALPATRLMEVTAGGRPLTAVPGDGGVMGELWLRSFAPVPAGSTVTVTVPALEAEEPGETRVRLPVTGGPVNREVTLGRWKLTLLRVEPDEGGIRVYVDLGPHLATSLAGFAGLEAGGRATSWGYQSDEQTGRMTWFHVPQEALGKGSVTLTLKRPTVVIEGPWVIEVPVQGK
jgi:hypothetical protein